MCCGLSCFKNFQGNNPEELIAHINDPELLEHMLLRINEKNRRDKFLVYSVTLVTTASYAASIFSFISLDNCDSKKIVVRNLTLWMSCFAIVCCALRVYFQREYILMPIVARFNLEMNDCFHKFMNICFALLTCLLAGNLAAIWSLANQGKQTYATAAMCTLLILSFFTAAWYMQIVKRVTKFAIRKLNNTTTAIPISTNSQV